MEQQAGRFPNRVPGILGGFAEANKTYFLLPISSSNLTGELIDQRLFRVPLSGKWVK